MDGTEDDRGSFTAKTLKVTGNKTIQVTLGGGGKTVQVDRTGTPLFTLGLIQAQSLP
jgi:hypothetical protein